MPKKIRDPAILNPAAGTAEGITEVRRQDGGRWGGGAKKQQGARLDEGQE